MHSLRTRRYFKTLLVNRNIYKNMGARYDIFAWHRRLATFFSTGFSSCLDKVARIIIDIPLKIRYLEINIFGRYEKVKY